MRIARDLADTVGHTPLIRLRKVSEETGCEILGKAEFMNPGQSVKDRAALFIIRDAMARGDLKPGGTIVEGTAGNTGIGLALVGASMGFKTVMKPVSIVGLNAAAVSVTHALTMAIAYRIDVNQTFAMKTTTLKCPF